MDNRPGPIHPGLKSDPPVAAFGSDHTVRLAFCDHVAEGLGLWAYDRGSGSGRFRLRVSGPCFMDYGIMIDKPECSCLGFRLLDLQRCVQDRGIWFRITG